MKRAEIFAKENKMSARTVYRASRYAIGLEKIEHFIPGYTARIMAGEEPDLYKYQIQKISYLPLEEIPKAIELFRTQNSPEGKARKKQINKINGILKIDCSVFTNDFLKSEDFSGESGQLIANSLKYIAHDLWELAERIEELNNYSTE